MGKLGMDDMDIRSVGGTTIKFSATKIGNLGASEYTLVTVAVDVSGSLNGLGSDLDKMLGAIVEACRDPRNPRCDNMMLRVLLFNDTVDELHGFRPVMDLNPSDYVGVCKPSGMTAALDAAYQGAKAAIDYAKDLVSQQFSVNGALFLLTDGMDNRSKATVKMVAEALSQGKMEESLESNMAVLIGIGSGSASDINSVSSYLKDIHDKAGFSQYVFAGDATPANLAKIGGFVSKSASSQSKALGTGGASQALSF